MRRRTWLKALLTVCFGVLFFAWSFYYLFPYDDVKEGLIRTALADTPFELRSGPLKPSLVPVRLSLSQLRLSLSQLRLLPSGAEDACEILRVPKAAFRVRMLPVLAGDLDVPFHADLFRGSVRGALLLDRSRRNLDVRASIQDLDLSLWKPDPACIPVNVTGMVSGNFTYRCDLRQPDQGEGTAAITASSGAVSGLGRYMIPVDGLTVRDARIALSVAKGRVRIEQCRIDAEELDAVVTGAVLMAFPVRNSRLSLRVQVTAKAAPGSKIPLPFKAIVMELRGTPAQPRIRFLSNAS